MKKQFIKILTPAPVLNRPDFQNIFGGKDGCSLLIDEKGHLRALEFVALKNQIFQVLQKCSNHILHVQADFYPHASLYVDERFTTSISQNINNQNFCLSPKSIIQKMLSCVGLPYIWGGNWSKGIAELLQYYPPTTKLSETIYNHWTLKGVDCSGLLYEATHGYTPRNTAGLFAFGQFLAIYNKSILEITALAQPLDLILFPGHVIIIIDQNTCIESKENNGVIISNLQTKLKELLLEKHPFNNSQYKKNSSDFFVIKRWIT